MYQKTTISRQDRGEKLKDTSRRSEPREVSKIDDPMIVGTRSENLPRNSSTEFRDNRMCDR